MPSRADDQTPDAEQEGSGNPNLAGKGPTRPVNRIVPERFQDAESDNNRYSYHQPDKAPTRRP